ncbi:MAG: hypothetical protein WDN46_24795 [Methylocella sp.]
MSRRPHTPATSALDLAWGLETPLPTGPLSAVREACNSRGCVLARDAAELFGWSERYVIAHAVSGELCGVWLYGGWLAISAESLARFASRSGSKWIEEDERFEMSTDPQAGESLIAEAGHALATQSKEQPPEDDYFV